MLTSLTQTLIVMRMSLNQHDSPHQHRLLELRAFNVQISHFLFSNDSYVWHFDAIFFSGLFKSELMVMTG